MKSAGAKKYFKERKGDIQKANKKKATYAFEFLSPNKLPAGDYYFRLLPKHPEKCPSGEEYLSSIKLPDPLTPFGLQLLLGESDGHHGECWFTDLTKALEKGGKLKKLPQVAREALAEALDPFDRLRYPTAWYLDITTKEVPAPTKADPDNVKTIKTYRSNPKKDMEQGIILDVWQRGINEDIQSAVEGFDNIRDIEEGRLLKMSIKGEGKTRRYKVSVAKKAPLRNVALTKKLYPDLSKFVESMVKDYDSQKLLFLEHMPETVLKALTNVGIDLDDPLGGSKNSKEAMTAMDDDFDDDDDDDDDGDDDLVYYDDDDDDDDFEDDDDDFEDDE